MYIRKFNFGVSAKILSLFQRTGQLTARRSSKQKTVPAGKTRKQIEMK